MTRRVLLACTFALLAEAASVSAHAGTPVSPPVDFAHLPWKSGETLTYMVYMEDLVEAAEGTFSAQEKDGHWEFKLQLASRGAVNTIYPFTGWFWSELSPPPKWRSVEYGEFRFEPKRVVKEQTRIDYAAHQGTRAIWTTGQTKTFPIAEDSVDDVGTMLYHLRVIDWKLGDVRILHVYESNSEKEAIAQCDGRETRAVGVWPSQPLLHLTVLPGKGTHHRGRLTLWMTDDARHLPLHADIDFRYGTFSIDLESAK